MSSFIHDVPLSLFRENPLLLVRLLRRVLRTQHGIRLPRRVSVEDADAQFNKIISLERRADLVVVLRLGPRKKMVVIIEVQRRPDRRKWRSWPLYSAILHDQHKCQVCLVVLAPEEATALWARKPINTLQVGSP